MFMLQEQMAKGIQIEVDDSAGFNFFWRVRQKLKIFKMIFDISMSITAILTSNECQS